MRSRGFNCTTVCGRLDLGGIKGNISAVFYCRFTRCRRFNGKLCRGNIKCAVTINSLVYRADVQRGIGNVKGLYEAFIGLVDTVGNV